VERDAVAIWWYNRVRRPEIDLGAFADSSLDRLRTEYKQRGRELWVLDLTTDLGLPVVAAVSCLAVGARPEVLLGFGAHPDRRIAVTRAITELSQSFVVVSDARRRVTLLGSDDWRAWLEMEMLDTELYLLPDNAAPRASSDQVEEGCVGVIDVAYLVDLLATRGLETLVVDQTRADIGLPVARVVVPGLRHFWPRFGSGRLYDVPVSLGWRSVLCDEADLNPMAIVF
jgi:ribosomal protein S12 methylthiotransferase accessory factor